MKAFGPGEWANALADPHLLLARLVAVALDHIDGKARAAACVCMRACVRPAVVGRPPQPCPRPSAAPPLLALQSGMRGMQSLVALQMLINFQLIASSVNYHKLRNLARFCKFSAALLIGLPFRLPASCMRPTGPVHRAAQPSPTLSSPPCSQTGGREAGAAPGARCGSERRRMRRPRRARGRRASAPACGAPAAAAAQQPRCRRRGRTAVMAAAEAQLQLSTPLLCGEALYLIEVFAPGPRLAMALREMDMPLEKARLHLPPAAVCCWLPAPTPWRKASHAPRSSALLPPHTRRSTSL